MHVISRLDRTHVALIEAIVNLLNRNPRQRATRLPLLVLGRIALGFTNYTRPDHGALPEIDSQSSTIIDRAIQIDVSVLPANLQLSLMEPQAEIQAELESLEARLEQGEVFDLDLFDTIDGQEPSDNPTKDEDDEGSEDGATAF